MTAEIKKLTSCPEHGKLVWALHVVCAKCFRICTLPDASEMCSCGERLLPVPAADETPENSEQEFSARVCCVSCAKARAVRVVLALNDFGLERLRV